MLSSVFNRRHLADVATTQQVPLRHVLPVDEPGHDLGPVEPAGHQIRLSDRRAAQRADDFRIVGRQTRRHLHCLRAQPGSGPKRHAPEGQVEVMVGEPEGPTVPPAHLPASAQRRRTAVEVRLKFRHQGHQSRTSTTGTLGTSPA